MLRSVTSQGLPVHPQRAMSHGDIEISVDDLWIPVLAILWSGGCSTAFCCQGDPKGRATAGFYDAASLELAHVLLARTCEEAGLQDVRTRMLQRSGTSEDWTVTAWPALWLLAQCERMPNDPTGPLYYGISMPHTDLLAMYEALVPAGSASLGCAGVCGVEVVE